MKLQQTQLVEGYFTIRVKDSSNNVKQEYPRQKNIITDLGMYDIFHKTDIAGPGQRNLPPLSIAGETAVAKQIYYLPFLSNKNDFLIGLRAQHIDANRFPQLDHNKTSGGLSLGLGSGNTSINERTNKFSNLVDIIGFKDSRSDFDSKDSYIYDKRAKTLVLKRVNTLQFTAVVSSRLANKAITELGLIRHYTHEIYKNKNGRYGYYLVPENPTDDIEKYEPKYGLATIAKFTDKQGQNYTLRLKEGDILEIDYDLVQYYDVTPKKSTIEVSTTMLNGNIERSRYDVLLWDSIFTCARGVSGGYYGCMVDSGDKHNNNEMYVHKEKTDGIDLNKLEVDFPKRLKKYKEYTETDDKIIVPNLGSNVTIELTKEGVQEEIFHYAPGVTSWGASGGYSSTRTYAVYFKDENLPYLRDTVKIGSKATQQNGYMDYEGLCSAYTDKSIYTIEEVDALKLRAKRESSKSLRSCTYINERGILCTKIIGGHKCIVIPKEENKRLACLAMNVDTLPRSYDGGSSILNSKVIWFSKQGTKEGLHIRPNCEIEFDIERNVERVSDVTRI